MQLSVHAKVHRWNCPHKQKSCDVGSLCGWIFSGQFCMPCSLQGGDQTQEWPLSCFVRHSSRTSKTYKKMVFSAANIGMNQQLQRQGQNEEKTLQKTAGEVEIWT